MKTMLELIQRCPEFVSGYREYCREMYAEGVTYFRPTPPETIDEGWFQRTKPWYDQREQGLVPGVARSYHHWAVDGDRFIGEFQCRTDFTEKVLSDIGSIGYAVRPSEWGKGYGTEILRQGLAIAKSLSMEKALLTVNEENKPSIHIIEKLGGILSDTIDAYNEVEGDHLLRRYWITL